MRVVAGGDPAAILAGLTPELLARNNFHIIDMGAIRAHDPARWERRRDMVREHVLRSFARATRVDDLIVPLSETEFLAVLPGASQAVAISCCGRVAQETFKYFLGDAKVPIRIARLAAITGGSVDARDIDDATIARSMLLERNDRDPPGRGSGAPMSVFDASQRERRVRFVVQQTPRIEATMNLDPIWKADRQAVASFMISPVVFAERDGVYEHLRPRDLGPKPALDLALRLIAFADEALAKARSEGRRFGLHVPVSVDVLTPSRERFAFIRRLQQLSADARSLLVFELVGCEQGMPQSRLLDLVAVLNGFGRGVIAQVDGGLPPPKAWLNSGLAAVSVAFDGTEPWTERDAMERLAAFAETGSLFPQMAVHGVHKRGLAMGAWSQGFALISGQVISDGMPGDGIAVRLTGHDIFARDSELI